jgi:hypothetical protein
MERDQQTLGLNAMAASTGYPFGKSPAFFLTATRTLLIDG